MEGQAFGKAAEFIGNTVYLPAKLLDGLIGFLNSTLSD